MRMVARCNHRGFAFTTHDIARSDCDKDLSPCLCNFTFEGRGGPPPLFILGRSNW